MASAVPELKQKKIARDNALQKEAAASAAAAVKAAAELEKTIFARAQAYEQEYQKVRILIKLTINSLSEIFLVDFVAFSRCYRQQTTGQG